MSKFLQIIVFSLISLTLAGCVTTDGQQYEKDQVIAAQVSAMSKSEKSKFCAKLKSNHAKYRKKIIPIIWANLKRQKNNQISYKQLTKSWLPMVNQPEIDGILGKEFSFYKQNMLLNLRYGLVAKCSWMNQKAV